MINENVIHELISQSSDPKLKKQLAHILSNNIQKQIYCLSKVCQGRIIGYLYSNGTLEADELRDKKGNLVSGALAIRTRFDTYDGVQCACGNDSRVAEQERGHLSYDGLPPTKEGVEAIYKNLEKKPTKYQEKNGSIEVDGFIIEKVNI